MEWKKDNWSKEDYTQFSDYLQTIAEDDYRVFNERIIPCEIDILGIRMPILRKIAKEIIKGNWKEYLKVAKDASHEEILLQGMVIASVSAKIEFSEVLRYITYFAPKMCNWAIVDSFCGDLKVIGQFQEEAFFFIMHYLKSEHEYEVRFAVIMLMDYYLDEAHIQTVFGLFDTIKHDGYYVKMAIAWAVSIAFIKLPDVTMGYLNHNHLSPWTYQKSLQKIVESNRIDEETKTKIRQMKQQVKDE